MAFLHAIKTLCNSVINSKQKLQKQNLSYYLRQKAISQSPPEQKQSDCSKLARTPWIIFSLCQRGSIAVETSLLLPIFIFFFLHLISILQFLSCYGRIEAALHQTGRKMSVHAYAYDKEETAPETKQNLTEDTKQLLEVLYAKAETEQAVGREYLDHSPVLRGADGIQYTSLKAEGENHWIDLTAVYQVRPMFAFPGVMDIRLINRCRMRAWTGYEVDAGGGGGWDRMVYVAENASVYHRSAACTHLRLSVKYAAADRVSGMRNQSGVKYYPCEICSEQTLYGNLCYITEQGNRYHHSLSCSGLKRNVRAIPLRDTSLPACSRCG